MAVKQIKSLVQFSRGTSIALNELTAPIPDGVVIFAIDDGSFRLGDGVSKYNELTTLFTYADLVSAQGGISDRFEDPTIDQNGKIAVVEYDSIANKVKYGVSETSLSSLLDSITALEANDAIQTDAIAAILAKALSIDVSINTANDNSIIVINSRRYASSGVTLSGVQNQIASQVTYVPGSHLEEVNFYTSQDKKFLIDKLNLDDNNYYYVDIVGFNNLVGFGSTPEHSLVYGLTAANSNVVTEQIEGSLFKVTFNNVTLGVKDNTPVVLIASIDNITGTAKVEKAVACLVKRQKIMVGVYGGSSSDLFNSVTIDSQNNIFCCGYTTSEGLGGSTYGDALVVKFDSSLNIVARKRYGGTSDDFFIDLITDSQDNIICAGYTNSEGLGAGDCLVVKFDNNLNIMARKRYGGSYADAFMCVGIDSQDNIICCGYSWNNGVNPADAIICKFDITLNLLAAKLFGNTTGIEQINGITTDSSDNIICVGTTYSEGMNTPANYHAIVVKFNTSLNIITQKRYGGSNNETFLRVTADSQDNIICVGTTTSEGAGSWDGLIIKFDSSLNILARKIYGGSGADIFTSVTVDSSDNIICVGNINSEGLGNYDTLIIKFDSSLNIITRKRYGGFDDDKFQSVAVDSSNNIVCTGWTNSEGRGVSNALVVKFPSDIPSGSFVGTIFSNMVLTDSTLTLADSTLTLANSTLTLANSTLTLADSTLTLDNSALTLTTDTLN